jgi:hypothetical protein
MGIIYKKSIIIGYYILSGGAPEEAELYQQLKITQASSTKPAKEWN